MKKVLRFIKLYGWIFVLIILLAIIINYFGVIPVPRGDIPQSRCIFQKGMQCLEQQIIGDDGTSHGVLKFRVKSEVTYTKNIEFYAYDAEDETMVPCIVSPNNGANLAPEQIIEVTCIFNHTFIAGRKMKFEISRTVPDGEIYDEVQ